MAATSRPGIERNPPSLLGVPGHRHTQVIHSNDRLSYTKAEFAGKDAQMQQVAQILATQGFVPSELIDTEVDWFYNQLGIDDSYFANDTAENVASYVLSLYSAKVSAYASDDHKFEIHLKRESDDNAVYIVTSAPGVSTLDGPQYEKIMDTQYLTPSNPECAWRLESFQSGSSQSSQDGIAQQLRCYFLYRCNFANTPEPKMSSESDIRAISDKTFLDKATPHTLKLYESVIKQVVKRMGPVIELYEQEGTHEGRLVIGYRQGTAPGYFAALSHLYHYYGLMSTRKYVEQFANGVTVASIYLAPSPNPKQGAPPIEHSIYQIVKEASLLFCLPDSVFSLELARGELSLQEAVYAHCGFIFVSHFLNRLGPEFDALQKVLDSSSTTNAELLDRLKHRLRGETFTREYIKELIKSHLDIVQALYLHFANIHYVQSNAEQDNFLPTLSYQRLQTKEAISTEELRHMVTKTLSDEHEVLVFNALLQFNLQVLKTNFYTPTKVALSFRLNPDFLPRSEYPQPLYGMFLVIGQEFRGFHLRFRDVARGGIRIVRSRNKEAYSINARSMFDENYNLANTQQRKNKDIPEGGSKGVILLNYEHQDKMDLAFQKYIDAIIDLLIPGQSPGIKEAIVDLYGKQEILFMGPDENTAGLVDWATDHAKARGAPWWKSFFTGKSPSIGGIPHDEYGMTSLSVREYVKGIYRKLQLEDKPVYKLQTGGPDGDLGSNEILLSTSNEVYMGIVDGSGVLADPNGLDKTELLRLATERKMINHYNVAKLSKDGYRVLVDDTDVRLPNGVVVASGVAFRNTYHLEAAKMHQVDVFVPCGGRPEAVNTNNVKELIDPETKRTRIPYIVEGANLFLTQTAKLELEKAGCVIFKDASTNKGGVTSSSLEVLASLAFDDEPFYKDMCVRDGKSPEFYEEYVKEVQERVKLNASLEFEALWRDHELLDVPRSILSDTLSNAINKLSDELSSSNLWDDVEFRNRILKQALPKHLVDHLGLDRVLNNVPDSYLRATFGSYLAGRYIYQCGTAADQFAFYEYMVAQQKA